MAVRKRTVDGKLQIWDDDSLDWRDVEETKPDPPMQQLNLFVDTKDWILRYSDLVPVPDPSEVKNEFVCGACGSDVEKITNFLGWMCESMDPHTGEIYQLEDEGVDDVKSIRYVCSKACGWSAQESWWLDINGKGQSVALYDEAEEKIQPQVSEDIRTAFDQIFKDTGSRPGIDYFQGGFLGGTSGGSIRTTSGTSGNTA